MDRAFQRFCDNLFEQTRLTAVEQSAVAGLLMKPQRMRAGEQFVVIGDLVTCTCLVVDGVCGRVQRPTEERRQITAVYVAGDMPDLYSLFHPRATSTMEALTTATISKIPHREMREIMRRHPATTEAFGRYLVADSAITTEWLANVGSRDARASLAHFFCEMAARLRQVNGNSTSFPFPISQSQLGEITGLSVVHVNRCLMALRKDGVMTLERGHVHILDWPALVAIAGFDDGYLVHSHQLRFAN